jgi:hypothetical protein
MEQFLLKYGTHPVGGDRVTGKSTMAVQSVTVQHLSINHSAASFSLKFLQFSFVVTVKV